MWTVITVALVVLAFLVLMLGSSLQGGFSLWRRPLSGDEVREEHRHRTRR